MYVCMLCTFTKACRIYLEARRGCSVFLYHSLSCFQGRGSLNLELLDSVCLHSFPHRAGVIETLLCTLLCGWRPSHPQMLWDRLQPTFFSQASCLSIAASVSSITCLLVICSSVIVNVVISRRGLLLITLMTQSTQKKQSTNEGHEQVYVYQIEYVFLIIYRKIAATCVVSNI